MTTESETKKPPAHEVIVALLQEYARTVQREARDASYNPEIAASLVIVEQQASALVAVLMRMHIPKEARPNVVRVLRDLPSACFPPTIESIFAEIEGDTGGA